MTAYKEFKYLISEAIFERCIMGETVTDIINGNGSPETKKAFEGHLGSVRAYLKDKYNIPDDEKFTKDYIEEMALGFVIENMAHGATEPQELH